MIHVRTYKGYVRIDIGNIEVWQKELGPFATVRFGPGPGKIIISGMATHDDLEMLRHMSRMSNMNVHEGIDHTEFKAMMNHWIKDEILRLSQDILQESLRPGSKIMGRTGTIIVDDPI